MLIPGVTAARSGAQPPPLQLKRMTKIIRQVTEINAGKFLQ